MIQSIYPYASAKTAEIMSRYRPIAPRPDNQNPNPNPESQNSALPTGVRNSAYLRRVWDNLQNRPTRIRKRGRNSAAALAPASLKRVKAPVHAPGSFIPISYCLDAAVANLTETVARGGGRGKGKGIDLNAVAGMEEPDWLTQFGGRLICPSPVRPVGSWIFVERLVGGGLGWPTMAAKGVQEVEVMVEKEGVPVIVSDSRNRVRMCNAAYKEMVGQPECGWLDCTAGGGGDWRRIGGKILVLFSGPAVEMGMHGFSCVAKIEWENKGVKRIVKALCEGVKLQLELGPQANKDYQFMWRFNVFN